MALSSSKLSTLMLDEYAALGWNREAIYLKTLCDIFAKGVVEILTDRDKLTIEMEIKGVEGSQAAWVEGHLVLSSFDLTERFASGLISGGWQGVGPKQLAKGICFAVISHIETAIVKVTPPNKITIVPPSVFNGTVSLEEGSLQKKLEDKFRKAGWFKIDSKGNKMNEITEAAALLASTFGKEFKDFLSEVEAMVTLSGGVAFKPRVLASETNDTGYLK